MKKVENTLMILVINNKLEVSYNDGLLIYIIIGEAKFKKNLSKEV